MVPKTRPQAFQVLAVALVLISAACANKSAAVKVDASTVLVHVGEAVKVDDSTALVHVGEIVGFTLKGTTWAFHESSDPSVLRRVTSPEPTVNCAPELGCGVTDAEYTGIAPGRVVVTATRGICGGHRCVGDEGVHRFKVVVYA
jgi:hypothetical protein